MNKKTIIALILTLLVGFILGFFLSGRLAHKRMMHIKNVRENPKMEQKFLQKRLRFSEEQMKEISPILDTHLLSQNVLRKKQRAEMDSLRKIMFTALDPFLNENQRKQVEKMIDRRDTRPSRHMK